MHDAFNEIIDRLIDEKFIDERRYCRAFVNDKLRFNHWGRVKIQAKLREKKLNTYNVTVAKGEEQFIEEFVSSRRSVAAGI